MMTSYAHWCRGHGALRSGPGCRTALLIVMASLSSVPAAGPGAPSEFSVLGGQFHQRDLEDAGEARICIRNTGAESLSMARLQVRILAEDPNDLGAAAECACLYARLLPPILPPGRDGQIVAKLCDRPASGRRLTGVISCPEALLSHTVSLAEPALWMSFASFSADLRKVYVYVENLGCEPVEAGLLEVGGIDLAGRARAIPSAVPPGDKACLTGDLPSPLVAGAFVPIVIGGNAGGQESKTYTMARVIQAMPIVVEGEGGDPDLGLDVRRPFLETMACPAHAHGTHEEAAAQFLDGYTQQYLEAPSRGIQMAICRSGMPSAWFRFGSLPDAAAMNPCLKPPSRRNGESSPSSCPFFGTGDVAKRAVEPGRFLAIIPTGPAAEEESLLLKGLTNREGRFLVYAAVASGAKGLIYRGLPPDDPLSRDAFRRLNREVQHLRSLLSIAEPVEWAATQTGNYTARSLLCGAQAIAVIVFDCRYFSREKDGRFWTPPFGGGVVPVRVQVKIPRAMVVQKVSTPFRSVDRDCWDDRDGVLEFTADMVDSAQAYILSIQSQVDPLEGGVSR